MRSGEMRFLSKKKKKEKKRKQRTKGIPIENKQKLSKPAHHRQNNFGF